MISKLCIYTFSMFTCNTKIQKRLRFGSMKIEKLPGTVKISLNCGNSTFRLALWCCLVNVK